MSLLPGRRLHPHPARGCAWHPTARVARVAPAQPCSEFPLLCFQFAPGVEGPAGPPSPAGVIRSVHADAPDCAAFPQECIYSVDGAPGPDGPVGPPGGPVSCGPQRAAHAVHPARRSVDVVIEGGQATAYLAPSVTGGNVIEVPAACLLLPNSGADLGPLTADGAAAAVAGLAALEVARKRRRFRFGR